MKKEKKVKSKAALGTLMALVMVFVSMVVFNAVSPFSKVRGPMATMSVHFALNTFFSVVILILSLYLTYIYLKDYLILRSPFTLAVLAAVFAFMVYAITSSPLVQLFFGVRDSLGLFAVLPPVFITIALGALAWASSK